MQWSRGSVKVVLACVAMSWLGMAGQARGQEAHGVTITKDCVSPLCVGETTSCDIKLAYTDELGDTIRILSAWDVQDEGGDNVRVPSTGDLPIVAAGGNTTCTIGGTLPCLVGPGGSGLGGLPGDSEPGFVHFRQDTYVVQPNDPDVLLDQATVEWEDLCDSQPSLPCEAGVVTPEHATASTTITRCHDDDACTIDTCQAGECTFPDKECDDNDACTTNGCVVGTCVFTRLNCDDGDGCTEDSCDSTTGECSNNPTFSCDDDDACTEDACDSATGGCTFTTVVVCNDGDACTADTCNSETGECEYTSGEACDDGSECTEDTCDSTTGECVFTTVVVCNDGDACTADTCNSETGECEYTSGEACDDGSECTEDTCDSTTGECVFTTIDPPPPGCGAGDGCTPGFWKQAHHFDYWIGYSPDDSFDAVFGVDAAGEKSLREAAWSRGGGESALMRHAVAALLNASTTEVNYLYTPDQVIAMVQEAFDTGDFNRTKDMFEEENERGCTVDKSGTKKSPRSGQRRGN